MKAAAARSALGEITINALTGGTEGVVIGCIRRRLIRRTCVGGVRGSLMRGESFGSSFLSDEEDEEKVS